MWVFWLNKELLIKVYVMKCRYVLMIEKRLIYDNKDTTLGLGG